MHPRAIATSLVALGLSFIVLVWLGRTSQDPLVVSPGEKPPRKVDDGRPEISETGPHPKAVFEELAHDFGMMKHMESGSHKFVVRNEGEVPLELHAGETTCQCTIGELGSSTVPPGESTVVELKWQIKNPAPRFEHSAEIWTNDPDNAPVMLRISGSVGRDLIFHPTGSWSLGTITTLSETRFEGMVFSQTSPKLQLLDVAMNSDAFSVETELMSKEDIEKKHATGELFEISSPEDRPVAPVIGYRVIVKVVKEMPVGHFSHRLKFRLKLNDNIPEIEESMPVTGTRGGPFNVFPLPGTRWNQDHLLIDIGTVKAVEGKESGMILLVRGGGDDFEITETTSDLKWLLVSTDPPEAVGNATRVKLNVKFPPDCPRLTRSSESPAHLTVKTTHPDAREIKMKLAFIVE